MVIGGLLPEKFSAKDVSKPSSKKKINTLGMTNQEGVAVASSFVDLFSMTPKQNSELTARIHHWGGLVRIFVHPYFTSYYGPSDDFRHHPSRDSNVAEGLKKLLSFPEEKTPPIIIFEERKRVIDTLARIDHDCAGQTGQNPYFVETFSQNSDPYAKGGFNYLRDVLERIGVSQILVSGIYMWIYPSYEVRADIRQENNHPLFKQGHFSAGKTVYFDGYSYLGCVGWTLVKLSLLGFRVRLSGFASPHNHRDSTLVREGHVPRYF